MLENMFYFPLFFRVKEIKEIKLLVRTIIVTKSNFSLSGLSIFIARVLFMRNLHFICICPDNDTALRLLGSDK